jgi:hypothetical protein
MSDGPAYLGPRAADTGNRTSQPPAGYIPPDPDYPTPPVQTTYPIQVHRTELSARLPWRTGRKVGRTIYAMHHDEPSDQDVLIGMMDSREIAQAAVIGHNLLVVKGAPDT